MSDLDAAIRAKLDGDEAIIKGADDGALRILGEADGWKAALLAVLDLHGPVLAFPAFKASVCDACCPNQARQFAFLPTYPCPTVRALAEKLGVEVWQ